MGEKSYVWMGRRHAVGDEGAMVEDGSVEWMDDRWINWGGFGRRRSCIIEVLSQHWD
jgi:hypothetical protein